MTPISTYQIPGGARVVIRTCDGWGAPNAPFGMGNLHEAIRTKDPSKMKVWCGKDGCRVIKAKEEGRAA
jgi:hypothetical protein